MSQADLTIRFYGLCLFTRATDENTICVYLAQPHHMPHRSIMRYQNGTGWSAREIPAGRTVEYGVSTTAPVALPPTELMSDIAGMPMGTASRRSKSEVGAAGADLVKVLLRGGELSVHGKIGIWKPTDGSPGEYFFPYRVEWRGEADPNQPHGVINIWNAPDDESPKLGDDSPFPTNWPTSAQAKARSAMHFKAYYQLLTGTDGPPIEWTGATKQAPAGDASEELRLLKSESIEDLDSLIVSSCPSAQARLAN